MEWPISKGVRDAHITENGIVKLHKQSLADWPTNLVYAAVHKAPEGSYITCLPERPPAPYMSALFRERKLTYDKKGHGLVELGDLCHEANMQNQTICITFPKAIPHPDWKTVTFELWDLAAYMRHDKNAIQEYHADEEKANRAIWPDTESA